MLAQKSRRDMECCIQYAVGAIPTFSVGRFHVSTLLASVSGGVEFDEHSPS
jgi:hypothetical protein